MLSTVLNRYMCLHVHTRQQDSRPGWPSLPVSWSWSCSSLSEQGGVRGLRFLSLCSPCPWSLLKTASLQGSPAFREVLGESGSCCLNCFSQFRVRWLERASQSSASVLRSTSPLTLGRGGLRSLSWPQRFLSGSVLIWGSSLT